MKGTQIRITVTLEGSPTAVIRHRLAQWRAAGRPELLGCSVPRGSRVVSVMLSDADREDLQHLGRPALTRGVDALLRWAPAQDVRDGDA